VTTLSFQHILETLVRHEVEFVVVGGVAAVLHGAGVTTFDLDTLIRVSDDNARRLLGAFDDLGAHFRGHTPSLRPVREDILAGRHLLLATTAGPLDVLGFIGRGDRFEDLADHVRPMDIAGLSVPLLGLDELIRQKEIMGRDKDQAALRLLREVKKQRDRPPGAD
jgi:hypothetical protein